MDVVSIDAPELRIKDRDGITWNIRYYGGKWGLMGWVATRFTDPNTRIRLPVFDNLVDLIYVLYMGRADDTVQF